MGVFKWIGGAVGFASVSYTHLIKKGVPLYSTFVNLKSNTMKNTAQRYGIPVTLQIISP